MKSLLLLCSVRRFADFLEAASRLSSEFSQVRDVSARFELLTAVHQNLVETHEKSIRALDERRAELIAYKKLTANKILVRAHCQ